MSATRRDLVLEHEQSGRLVPVEVVTVFGRSDAYYRYQQGDDRPDRLAPDVVEGLAALNYVKICSDHQVSRTHGLVDPELPGVCDLNSTNGTYVNRRAVPTRPRRRGPLVEVHDGDRIVIGGQLFKVHIQQVSVDEHTRGIRRVRLGVVMADAPRRARAERLATHLQERKGFTVRQVAGGPALISELYRLQSLATPEGLVVCAIAAELRGEHLVLAGEPEEQMELVKLLPLLASVPGRKILVLDGEGDPSACERVFARVAFEDMVLLTSPGPVELIEPIAHSMRTNTLEGVRQSVSGEHPAARGAFDEPLDGIEALIGPDTNILDVRWVGDYRGRLRVVFGAHERADEYAISHSLRLGSTTFRF